MLFDNGAGAVAHRHARTPGDPYPGFEQSFSSFPIPGTTARTWYLGPSGALGDTPPTSGGINSFTANANALPLTDFGTNTETGGLWGNASQWQWNWQQNPSGTAVSYVSAPLTANTTVIGSGAVNLWVRSSTPDVDLQATISEVRPDGNETFVQNGWIRASERKLVDGLEQHVQAAEHRARADPDVHRGRRVADAGRPVRQGRRPALLRGPRVPRRVAHPGDDLGAERHATGVVVRPDGAERHRERLDRVLAVDAVEPRAPGRSGRDVPTPLPACPSLRNEPCRPYQAIVNKA